MKYTENLKLKKPEQTDAYNVEDFNENADTVDVKLKELSALLAVEDISSDFMTHNSTDDVLSAPRIRVFKQGNVITGSIDFVGAFPEAGGNDCIWTVNEKYTPLQNLVIMPSIPYDDTSGYGSAAVSVQLYNRRITVKALYFGYSTVNTTFSYICQ